MLIYLSLLVLLRIREFDFSRLRMSTHSSEPLLSGSVGRAGKNHADDVKIVRLLFELIAPSAPARHISASMNELVAEIRGFQRKIGFPAADGRIDVHGRTLGALIERAARAGPARRAGLNGPPELIRRIERALVRSPHRSCEKLSASRRATTPSGGGTAKLTDADFAAAAAALAPGVQIAMIRAFAEVESGGKSGFGPDGLPIIAYEGHIFRKLTGRIYDATHPLLSYAYKQKAGPEWQANNKDQKTAWTTLKIAIELDRDAALQSCSWGMFQVMGFNFSACGYADVDGFVARMMAGERGQLDAFVGYCKKKAGLRQALADKNFATCALLYNGEDYGDYDKRIERAFKKHGGR